MANKWTGFRKGLGKTMMAFGDPDLYKDYVRREEEERKRKAILANIQAMQEGGLGSDIYPKGISGKGELSYGIRGPEEKMKLAEQMKQFQRQGDIEKYMGAKSTLETPPISPMERPRLMGMPKEQAKQAIGQRFMLRPQARQAIGETPKELQGRNFLLTAEGKYRETAPKLPKETNANFDTGLTDKVISRLGTDRSETELFIKNISKFKNAGVDINKVMNALYKTAAPKEKEGWLKKLMGMFIQ